MSEEKILLQVRVQRGMPIWGFIDLKKSYKKIMCQGQRELEERCKEKEIELCVKQVNYSEGSKNEEEIEWTKEKFGNDFRWYLSNSIMIEVCAKKVCKEKRPCCVLFKYGLLYIFQSGFIAIDFMCPEYRLKEFVDSKYGLFNEVRNILECLYYKLEEWGLIIPTKYKLKRSSFIERISEENKKDKSDSFQITPHDYNKLMLDGDKGAHNYHHIRIKKCSEIKKNVPNEKPSFLYPIGKFHLNFERSFINIFIKDKECAKSIWESKEISLLTYGIIRILAIQSWLAHGIISCRDWLSILPQTLITEGAKVSSKELTIAKQVKDNLPTLNPFTWSKRMIEKKKKKKIEEEIEKKKKKKKKIEEEIEIEKKEKKKIEEEIEKKKKKKKKIEEEIEIEKKEKKKKKIEEEIEKKEKKKKKIEEEIEKKEKKKKKIEEEIEKMEKGNVGHSSKLGTYAVTLITALAYFVDVIYDENVNRLSTLILEGQVVGEIAIESITDSARVFLDHWLYIPIVSKSQIMVILNQHMENKAVDQNYNMYKSMAEDVSKLAKNVQGELSDSLQSIQDARKVSVGYAITIATTLSAVIMLLFGSSMLLNMEKWYSKPLFWITLIVVLACYVLLISILVLCWRHILLPITLWLLSAFKSILAHFRD